MLVVHKVNLQSQNFADFCEGCYCWHLVSLTVTDALPSTPHLICEVFLTPSEFRSSSSNLFSYHIKINYFADAAGFQPATHRTKICCSKH